jgi:hypothetical protein
MRGDCAVAVSAMATSVNIVLTQQRLTRDSEKSVRERAALPAGNYGRSVVTTTM